MKEIILAGYGPGSDSLVTGEVEEAFSGARLIITSERLAQCLRSSKKMRIDPEARIVIETRSGKICSLLEEMICEASCDRALCLFSGDSGFYSGASILLDKIRESASLGTGSVSVRVLPGISSFSLLCARLGIRQQDIALCSAHGRDCSPVREVMKGKDVFFLTGGQQGPAWLCAGLSQAGLGDLSVTVAERLGEKDERIRTMTADQAGKETFDPLSVILVRRAFERRLRNLPGIPDELFVRGKVPMTKRQVRILTVSMLDPDPENVCWDLGAGTGSVSVELSGFCREVISVERNPEAVRLTRENREKFGAWNMRIVEGEIPEILDRLPDPDRIFVGGGGRHMRKVLERVRGNEPGRICAGAITLETLNEAVHALEEYGYEVLVSQIAVTDMKRRGGFHMMEAHNPVFLITGEWKDRLGIS